MLALPLSIDDLELAFFKEQFAEGYGKQTGKVIAQRNYVNSPSTESGVLGGVGVFGGAAAVATADSTDKHSGSYSVKVVTDGTATGQGVFFTLTSSKLFKKGDIYKGAFWCKVPAGVNAYIFTRQNYFTPSGSLASYDNQSSVFVGTGNWQRVETDVLTMPGDGDVSNTYIGLRFSNAVPVTAWVDDVVVSKGSSSPSYFDGDTTDNNVFTYEWEGTAGNSSSIKWSTEPILAENLAAYTFNPTDSFSPTAGCTLEVTNDYVSITNNSGVVNSPAFTIGATTTNAIPIVDNTQYYFSLNARHNAIDAYDVQYEFWFYDTAGVDLTPSGYNPLLGPRTTIPSGKEISIKTSFTPPLGAGFVRCVPRFLNVPDGAKVTYTAPYLSTKDFGFFKPDSDSAWTGSPFTRPSALVRKNRNAKDFNWLQHDYFSKGSGLTPKERYSVADHMINYLKNTFKAVTGGPITVVKKNLVPNPKAAVNTSGWNTPYVTSRVAGEGAGFAIRCTIGAAPNPTPYIISDSSLIFVQEGKTYSLRARAKYDITDPTQNSLRMDIRWFDKSGSSLGLVSTPVGPNNENWNDYTYDSAVAPAGSAYALVIVYFTNGNNGGTANGTLDLSNVLLTEGPLVPYFDGDSGANYRWNGTPNASTSDQVDPSKHGLTDLLMNWYMSQSGLPAGKSVADHEQAMYKTKLGL